MPKIQMLATDGNKSVKSGKMAYSQNILLMCYEIFNERYMDWDKTILLHNNNGSVSTLCHAGKGEYI